MLVLTLNFQYHVEVICALCLLKYTRKLCLFDWVFYFSANNSKRSVCTEGVGTGWNTNTQGNVQPAAHAHRNWMELSLFSGVQVERGPVSMIL